MKKVKLLLQKLPEPYKTKALAQANEEFFNESLSPLRPIITRADALVNAFNWATSSEGYDYWLNVHKGL